MLTLLKKHVGELNGMHIAVLGLSFKPNTDDIRESRSIPIIHALLEQGATVTAYDPLATENMRRLFPHIEYCDSPEKALESTEGCLLMTEWPMFKDLDFSGMAQPIVVDGRRIIPEDRRDDIIYEGICW